MGEGMVEGDANDEEHMGMDGDQHEWIDLRNASICCVRRKKRELIEIRGKEDANIDTSWG